MGKKWWQVALVLVASAVIVNAVYLLLRGIQAVMASQDIYGDLWITMFMLFIWMHLVGPLITSIFLFYFSYLEKLSLDKLGYRMILAILGFFVGFIPSFFYISFALGLGGTMISVKEVIHGIISVISSFTGAFILAGFVLGFLIDKLTKKSKKKKK